MNVRGVFQTQILSLKSGVFACVCQEFDRLRLILKPEQFPEGLNGPIVSVKVQPLTGTTLELNGRVASRLMRPPESYEVWCGGSSHHRESSRSSKPVTPLKLGAVPHL